MNGITWDDEITWDDQQAAQPTAQQPQLSTLAKVGRGMGDPVDAAAQLLTKILPQGAVTAGNQLNNWLASKGLPLDVIPEGGIDQQLRESEQQYQSQRQAQGEIGIDWARMGGNLLSPANVAIASKIPVAASLAGKVGTGVASGAGMGLLQPVTQGGFWEEKGKQAAIGGVAGGVLPAVSAGLARVVRPNVDPAIAALTKEGVKPTIGQQFGGVAKGVEEKLASVPFVGDAIKRGQTGAIEQFNRAAVNRALSPIGHKLPDAVPVGREAVTYAIDKLDDAYNGLLPQLKGKLDGRLMTDLGKLRKMTASLPPAERDQFENIVKTEIIDRFTGSGLASGETIKAVESQLGGFSRGLGSSGDFYQRKLGEAIGEAQRSLRKMLERVNPTKSGELSKINKGYANLLRVQRASTALGAPEGVFTPAQLTNAVKAMDVTRNKRGFATGQALMQDLAEAGKSTLSPTIPNSGTVDRGLMTYLATNPVKGAAAYAGGLLGGSLYSPTGRTVTNFLLNARPEFADPLAKVMRDSSMYLLPGAIPAANSLLYQP